MTLGHYDGLSHINTSAQNTWIIYSITTTYYCRCLPRTPYMGRKWGEHDSYRTEVLEHDSYRAEVL